MWRKLIKIMMTVAAIWVGLVLLGALATGILEWICSDMHGELEWSKSPDSDGSVLVYHGNSYYPTNTWLDSDITDDDVEIGWSYGFPFPNFYYYTDGTETPLCILSKGSVRTREVYIRSDYDFKKQRFGVDGTDIEFVFEEAFIQSKPDTNGNTYLSDVVFSLKDEPRLKIYLSLYQVGDTVYFVKNRDCWVLSESLISALKANHIICE